MDVVLDEFVSASEQKNFFLPVKSPRSTYFMAVIELGLQLKWSFDLSFAVFWSKTVSLFEFWKPNLEEFVSSIVSSYTDTE